MDIIIKGKREESKTLLAHIIAKVLPKAYTGLHIKELNCKDNPNMNLEIRNIVKNLDLNTLKPKIININIDNGGI